MTALEQIHKELKERFKDEPNINLILGYTMGVIDKYKPRIIEEGVKSIIESQKQQNKCINYEKDI